MPLPSATRKAVNRYASSDLPALKWHIEEFAFLKNRALQRRVGREFYTARYLYKILEGLRIGKPWGKAAQVRLQILQYAAVYEACLHHMLFVRSSTKPEVKALLAVNDVLIAYSVPPSKRASWPTIPHGGKAIVPAFKGTKKRRANSVRFEDKVATAISLGMIKPNLGADLRQIYEARNSIHLHAELRKQLKWPIEVSRLGYRRMKPFCEQLRAYR